MSVGCRAYDRPMRVTRVVAILAAGALAAGPGVAHAATYAPPGKAGLTEYSETLPAAGGNVGPPSDGGHGTALSALGSGRTGARRLAKLGSTGAAAAEFARASAPLRSTPTRSAGAQDARRPAISVAGSGGSAVSGVFDLLGGSDGDGIGVFLPGLLAFGLGWGVAVVVMRSRHGGRSDV